MTHLIQTSIYYAFCKVHYIRLSRDISIIPSITFKTSVKIMKFTVRISHIIYFKKIIEYVAYINGILQKAITLNKDRVN